MISGFLFGIVAAFSFGTADFLAGLASRRIGSYATLFYMQTIGMVVLSIYMITTGEWISIMSNGQAVLLAMIFMGIDLFGILCLYQALATGNVSVVTPIASSFAVVTVLLSIVFGEQPSTIQLLAIFLTIVGIVLTTIHPNKVDKSKEQTTRGVYWAILAAILLGIAFFGVKYPTAEIGAFTTVWIGRLQAVVISPLFLLLLKSKLSRPQLTDWIWILLVGILDLIAFVSYNIGLLKANTSIVASITSLFAVISIFWGKLVWREKMTQNQVIGIFLVFVGILLIGI